MVTHLYLGVIILAVFATTVANADIQVACAKDSVKIIWKIGADLVPNAARLFLGNCMASHLDVLPTGEGEVEFNSPFAECKFKKLLKGKFLIYQNELTYRPQPKSKPAAFKYPIECVYKRPEGWVPAFLNPGSGVSEGRSGLVFRMALLNAQLTSLAETNVIPLGSFIPIWATVDQVNHQPLLLLMEECVAATTPELQPSSQVYPIINNKGCLLESAKGNARFIPRYHSSSLILYMQSFHFRLGEPVYIHCKLVAWDPEFLGQGKKACQYSKENGSWELLDDPSQSGLCSCCDSTCTSRYKRGVDRASQHLSHNSVLGPLIIVDPSDSRAHNTSVGSFTATESWTSLCDSDAIEQQFSEWDLEFQGAPSIKGNNLGSL
ncbi:zona pellucida sperm-binding protein 3-like [Scomber scombrus]|uniref:zona pellucida sperm-binding protein 3-like n=1 Tax=Scomber scombrus TaxID=13677 RepID=UPI002DD89D7B|nr:zona pellucida sperm-binding protein 3-like [Scomber scombrus]